MKREPSRKFRLSTTLKPNEGNSSSSSNGSRQPSRKSQKERYRIKGNWIVFIIHNNTFDVTLWQMLSHSLYLSRTHTYTHTHTHATRTRARTLSLNGCFNHSRAAMQYSWTSSLLAPNIITILIIRRSSFLPNNNCIMVTMGEIIAANKQATKWERRRKIDI